MAPVPLLAFAIDSTTCSMALRHALPDGLHLAAPTGSCVAPSGAQHSAGTSAESSGCQHSADKSAVSATLGCLPPLPSRLVLDWARLDNRPLCLKAPPPECPPEILQQRIEQLRAESVGRPAGAIPSAAALTLRIALDGKAYSWPEFQGWYRDAALRCWNEAAILTTLPESACQDNSFMHKLANDPNPAAAHILLRTLAGTQ